MLVWIQVRDLFFFGFFFKVLNESALYLFLLFVLKLIVYIELNNILYTSLSFEEQSLIF
jgi:hypothetical protein